MNFQKTGTIIRQMNQWQRISIEMEQHDNIHNKILMGIYKVQASSSQQIIERIGVKSQQPRVRKELEINQNTKPNRYKSMG